MFVHSHHTLIVLLYDEKEKERKQYFSKIQPYSIFTQNGLSITSLNLHHHKISNVSKWQMNYLRVEYHEILFIYPAFH